MYVCAYMLMRYRIIARFIYNTADNYKEELFNFWLVFSFIDLFSPFLRSFLPISSQ